MKQIIKSILLATIILLGSSCQKKDEQFPEDIIEYVNPFIGTDFHGHTYPGATSPHGMVQLSPITRWEGWDACSGYHYSDDVIYGFAHTQLSGTGASDLSDILFYPSLSWSEVEQQFGEENLEPQAFSHNNEQAHAGYYEVELDNGIKVELATTQRVGAHRYSFPKGEERVLAIDLYCIKRDKVNDAKLNIENDRELSGYVFTDGWAEGQRVYFYARFSESFTEQTIFQEDTYRGPKVRGLFAFDKSEQKPLEVFVGLSLNSVEGAKANLENDLEANQNFDQVKANNETLWSKALQRIEIKSGGTLAERETFYTALYHALVVPNLTSDFNQPNRYSTLSLWDTYRAWHPLITLIDHDLVRDMVDSMMEMYEAWGELPIWPLYQHDTKTMIGYHAVSVIADAYLRGIYTKDPKAALAAMIQSSNINKKGSDLYTKMGYIPANLTRESVSCTLEYSYDDWCIAMMAKAMGEEEVYQTYASRAMNYAHVFDPSTNFFRGRKDDGTWISPFNPAEVSRDFTEANAWQYRFASQHDIFGLAQLYGGVDALREALDAMFADEGGVEGDLVDITGVIGQYAHGNEPSHHLAFLYSYLRAPWQTEELSRHLLDEMYSNQPDGIIGNEDCGQMSAWYILSALGFYSVVPGSGEFVLTTPLFEEVAVQLANGKELQIKANDPANNLYIERVLLNGEELNQLYVTYDQLMSGGTLEFVLSSKPNKERANLEAPYSFTKESFPSIPYSTKELTYFDDEVEMELQCSTPETSIYYSLDGGEFQKYTEPVILTKSGTVRTYSELPSGVRSPEVMLQIIQAEYLTPASAVNGSKAGVMYKYYTGSDFKESVHNLERMGKLTDSGTMEKVSIKYSPEADFFGYIFTGYINIEESGIYDFQVASDDGSTLKINNQLIVNNDGSHAMVHATGRVALKQGFYPFELRYYQGDQGKGLSFMYKKADSNDYVEVSTFIE